MKKAFAHALLLGAVSAGKVNVPTKEIAAGVHMPIVNIGTWTADGHAGEEAPKIVGSWLGQGGRGIDTALIYGDQAQVAKAITDAGFERKDVFITTKIPGCAFAQKSIDADLKRLNTSYIDLLLIHSHIGVSCVNTWKVLEDNVKQGKLKSIGVSNFKVKHLQEILKEATIKPAVNQVEYNVFSHDEEVIEFCHKNGIGVEAWSPMAPPYSKKSVFHEPTVSTIAKAHNRSEAQIALRWIVQRGDMIAVLSSNPEHQAQDADLWSFKLSSDEMNKIGSIAQSEIIV